MPTLLLSALRWEEKFLFKLIPAMADAPFQQVSVEELAIALQTQGKDNLQLVDVREPSELAISAIEGFTNLPLSQHEQWGPIIYQHLNPEKETYVLCHHGIRSAQMCYWLNQQGFQNVKNINGGIDAYSLTIDASIPRY